MESYINRRTAGRWWASEFPVDAGSACGISGHSMGGHGALTLALRLSAAIPQRLGLLADQLADPLRLGTESPGTYLGSDQATWRGHDASLLIESAPRAAATMKSWWIRAAPTTSWWNS